MTFEANLPIDLSNGNEGRTKHFGGSAKRREAYEKIARAMGLVRTPPAYRQRVTVTRILGPKQKLFDPSSLGRGNYKELEDALTACGWWQDDSARWIERVDFRQDSSRRREGPAVIVRVEPA